MNAIEMYIRGRITLSEAASIAGLTIIEMERYLVDYGFESKYSAEDVEKEVSLLK